MGPFYRESKCPQQFSQKCWMTLRDFEVLTEYLFEENVADHESTASPIRRRIEGCALLFKDLMAWAGFSLLYAREGIYRR